MMNPTGTKTVIGLLFASLLLFGAIGLAGAQESADTVTLIDLATAENGAVTISDAGTYQLSGALADGQVLVAAAADSAVTLILDGVTLSSTTSAPIEISSAASVVIALADGSENTVQLDAAYAETSAAIHSAVDLTIAGTGSLTIVSPNNDGIAGDASLTIADAPTLTINAGDDAVQVALDVTIDNGTLSLVAGGGSGATLSDELSGKGIVADGSIVINDGVFTVDVADDAIRAEQDLTVNAGTITITALGKALRGTQSVTVNNGTITIFASDEGIEGGFIYLNDGQIYINASDDGINVSEPDDIAAPNYYYLYIKGGTIVINAEGDGIDSNGSIDMSGGVVIVNGPTISSEGAIDYDGTFTISGGLLVAAGSAGMPSAPGLSGMPGMMAGGDPRMGGARGGGQPPAGMQPPTGEQPPAGAGMAAAQTNNSTQVSVLIVFDAELPAGTLVSIQSADGDQLLTFAPAKNFQSLVFSSPDLELGATYTIYTGGSSDGTAANGLYTDGTYTPGTEYTTFTVTAMTTQVGSASGPR